MNDKKPTPYFKDDYAMLSSALIITGIITVACAILAFKFGWASQTKRHNSKNKSYWISICIIVAGCIIAFLANTPA